MTTTINAATRSSWVSSRAVAVYWPKKSASSVFVFCLASLFTFHAGFLSFFFRLSATDFRYAHCFGGRLPTHMIG